MIQTQLVSTAQAAPVEPRVSSPGFVSAVGTLADGGENEASFARVMSGVQGGEPAIPASQPEQEPVAGAEPGAKSLASEAKAAGAGDDLPEKAPVVDSPDDFLQQLRASLGLDASLIAAPSLSPSQADGHRLPAEAHRVGVGEAQPDRPEPAAAREPPRLPASALVASWQRAGPAPVPAADEDVAGSAPDLVASGPVADRGDDGDRGDEIAAADPRAPLVRQEGARGGGVPGQSSGAPGARQPDEPDAASSPAPLPREKEIKKAAAGHERLPPVPAVCAPAPDLAVSGQAAGSTPAPVANEGVARWASDPVASGRALESAPEPAASALADGNRAGQPFSVAEGEVSRHALRAGSGPDTDATPDEYKGEREIPRSASRPEPGTNAGSSPAGARAEPKEPRAAGGESAAGMAPLAFTGPPVGAGSEARGATKPDVKRKSTGAGGVEAEEAPGAGRAERAEVSGPLTPAQAQAQTQAQHMVGDSKPVAEMAVRRDLPDLLPFRLASQEAPEQLQQKVTMMLTDRLQQAEIQLDPLGLGRMKIQIRIDASSQASVQFLVQHGQTRELLEQAMPRLRDMLAGQGIQLGQTLVQQPAEPAREPAPSSPQPLPPSSQQAQQHSQPNSQQHSQQHSQGQSAFSGRGQGEGNQFAAYGRGEDEATATLLNLRLASTGEAGIDFYA